MTDTKTTLEQFVWDFRFGFEKNKEAIGFIRQHCLWEGFWKFGWVFRLILFMALIAGWKFFDIFRQWLSQADVYSPVALSQSVASLFGNMASEGYNFFFFSGFKYIVLILVEIIVFHFVRQTLEIKTGFQQDFTPKNFVKAEIRMIKVVIRNFIYESVLILLLGIFLSILGLSWIKTPLAIGIQAYFLGFAMVDNYHEVYGMSIRQSAKQTRHYPGLTVAIGLTTYALLLIPVLGAFLAPFLVAVTATLAFHDLRAREGKWRLDWKPPLA